MTEYELGVVRQAFERALVVGAVGLSVTMREVIVMNALNRLRHQLNLPRPPLTSAERTS